MELVVQYTRSRDGTRIAYGVAGQGQPLVYLGPACLSHVELYPKRPDGHRLLSALARDRMLICMDFRGTGMSDRNANDLSPEALTDDLDAVICDLRLASMDILSSAIRMTQAIRFAVRRPGVVRRMVLISPWTQGEPATPGILAVAEGNWPTYVGLLVKGFADAPGHEPEIFGFMNQCFDQANFVASGRASRPLEDWTIAERVQCPVLVIDDHASMAIEGHTEAVASRFSNASLVRAPMSYLKKLPAEVLDFLDAPDEQPGNRSGAASTAPRTPALSGREREILALFVAGLTQREIAEHLVIAPATVSRHVVSLYEKLGVHRRAEAVVWAMRHGIE